VELNPALVLVVTIAVAAVHGPAPALAQGGDSSRGSTGVFDRKTPDPAARQTLDLTMSLTAAYDSDVSVEAARSIANQLFGPESIAHANQLLGNSTYRWKRRDLEFRASGRSVVRHDRQTNVIRSTGHSAAAGMTTRLPWRSTLMLNQTESYSPAYLYALFPRDAADVAGDAPALAADYDVTSGESLSLGSQATLTRQMSRRTIIALTADRQQTNYLDPDAGLIVTGWYGVSGRFTRFLGRNTKGTVRYIYRAGNFPDADGTTWMGTSVEEGMDISMVHDRPFSDTRRLTLEAGVGSSVITIDAPPDKGTRRDPSYRLTGQLGAAYLFRKTWQASARYRRGVDVVPGITEPVATDGVTARIDGYITRRIDMQVAASYTSGASALSTRGQNFNSYTSNTRLRIALTEPLAMYVEYVYYLYDFRGYPRLVPGTPAALERNGVRAGFTLSTPVLGR
jgi:hypothetical protein